MNQYLVSIIMKNKNKTRENYGVLAGIASIVGNVLLFIIKFVIGILSNSISIQSDSFNNLSDAGSNVATIFGFILSKKPADKEHPYGHGRIEYIIGLGISFLICFIGFQMIISAIKEILNPSDIIVDMKSVIILSISLIIKIWMGLFNKHIGNIIDSVSLKAVAQDSFNDVLITSTTIISLLITYFFTIKIDGYIGLLVSLFIIKSGWGLLQQTMNPLLGQVPNHELVLAIKKDIMQYDGIIGIHDFVMHDYGPGRQFLTLHAEVPADSSILDSHEMIDKIEREIGDKYKITTTIHMDPTDTKDPYTLELKAKIIDLISLYNNAYTIHDFRIVHGKNITNVLFDVVINCLDSQDEERIRKDIQDMVKSIDDTLNPMIEIDINYDL